MARTGVAGVTQDAVLPGGTFVYRFRPSSRAPTGTTPTSTAGEAITRGLYGALVVQPAAGLVTGVDLVLPFHTQGRTSMFADSDEMRREVLAVGTPVRLRLVNTDQQPRRFALSGTPFRVVALDGVDLNGPTEVQSGQAPRVPAGGRYDLAFAMPAGPVRLSVEGARQAWACCWPRPATSPTRGGGAQGHVRPHDVRDVAAGARDGRRVRRLGHPGAGPAAAAGERAASLWRRPSTAEVPRHSTDHGRRG